MAISTLYPSRPHTPGSVDFYRPVHAILGLPIDAVGLHTARERIYIASRTGRPCFLSTPNLNFAIACLDDADFRRSVINSDLSTADGMPLVWMARLLGIPLRERVSGASLFESLQKSAIRLSIYFFGGPPGAASAAAAKINARNASIQCVGGHSPGFDSVEAMSSETIIDDINNSQADFLIVALGARKGQAWIEHNRSRLRVPVMSHLGAVVNFAAGSVRRAPPWMQNAGLEWLWRIKEEPMLWSRYLHDGLVLVRLLFTRILPGMLYQRLRAPGPSALDSAWITLTGDANQRSIKPHGAWQTGNLLRLRSSFDKVARMQVDVDIDLSDTSHVDSAFIGLLMLMYGHQSKIGRGFATHGASPALSRIFKSHCADFLLTAPLSPATQAPACRPATAIVS